MTQREFSDLLESVPHLSPEQLLRLRTEVDNRLAAPPTPAASDEELQRRLLEAGILGELKPSLRVDTGTERFTPITISGEPLSETVIRERR